MRAQRSGASEMRPRQAGVRGRGDGESLWDGIYRVIRETGKPGGCPIKTDSGQVIGPDESATLLAETFFPDDRVDTDDPYHTEVRRRTDGSSQPPEAWGSARVDPPLPGLRLGLLLKHSTLERPWH
ncbi:hypothetical protein EVAR_83859_1 [Eumeta japonica]|uniref:Uncharacterized protein n=1 Tax=Eumeta variegata TaxID=151549 RepID=A0A4C1URW6_EUMVA|nr:hypothetical protein EVAR_83859_1 [Eumeta japonica]